MSTEPEAPLPMMIALACAAKSYTPLAHRPVDLWLMRFFDAEARLRLALDHPQLRDVDAAARHLLNVLAQPAP